MTFQMLTQYNAKNFTPGPRTVTGITIHWWGDPVGQTFEGIIDWFCNPNSSVTTSAHYVVEAGRAACIVSPDDIAWHAGDWNANVANIGIECNPRATDADYQTIGELVSYLRGIYGDVPLYPHRHWTTTTCPGVYDVNRIDAIARGADPQPAVAPQASSITPITPTPQEDDVPYSQWPQADKDALKADLYNALWGGGSGLPLIYNYRLGRGEWPGTILGSFENRLRDEILPPAIAKAPTGTATLSDAQVQTIVDHLKAAIPGQDPNVIANAVLAAIKAQANK